MVFSSLSFLVVFLPVLIVLFFIIPARKKNARQYALLFFSLCFYGSGEPLYIFLIITCISVTWLLSSLVRKKQSFALILSILVNIIPLIITKYARFIVSNICFLFRITDSPIPNIVMPIGISFYTFQVITYIVDLYTGKIKQQENPLLFALYIMFFPQLIAGPIVKYSEIENELENPDVNWTNIQFGTHRFIVGLGKKVLIANQAGYIANAILRCPISSITTGIAWLCVVAYTVQIYFDFSGYSEMAIGLGAIFGFHFPENFQNPYTSKSVTDFWRKWHITLGRFFREYIYMPLGGNRVSKSKWVINIFIVWALTGLWHGASWNFVIWGLYYGCLIIFEKVTGIAQKLPTIAGWIVTLFFVMVGWGIFMCDGIPLRQMLAFLEKLFFIRGKVVNPITVGTLKVWGYIPFLIIGFIITTPFGVALRTKVSRILKSKNPAICVLSDAALIAVLIMSLFFLIGGTYNPFIYFRF